MFLNDVLGLRALRIQPILTNNLDIDLSSHPLRDGAHDRDRTGDLVLTKDVLYQLSYVGLVCSITTTPDWSG